MNRIIKYLAAHPYWHFQLWHDDEDNLWRARVDPDTKVTGPTAEDAIASLELELMK